MPFVTEEIWQALPERPGDGAVAGGDRRTITLTAFPAPEPAWHDDEAVSVMALVQEVITSVRTVRSEWGVPPSTAITAVVGGAGTDVEAVLGQHGDLVRRLANLSALEFAESVPQSPDTVRRVVRHFQLHIPLAGIVDRTKETERIKRDLTKLTKQRDALKARLANRKFVERADPTVVSDARSQEADLAEHQAKLEEILQELGG